MINKTTTDFLKDLKKNNTREWFEANRKRYEAAKANILDLATQLISMLGGVDKDLATLQPKDCMFRINRDIRFSKNKDPYKSNMSLQFSKGGKKSNTAAFYVHIEPGQAFIGVGFWAPEAPKLNAIRQEIDYNYNDVKKIFNNKKFIETFGKGFSEEHKLQRAPKGYEETNPAIEMLKLKSYIVTQKLSDSLLQDKNFAKEIASSFKIVKPLIDFLNTAE
jgi:uncharacterized protein (TIGR02453 family)